MTRSLQRRRRNADDPYDYFDEIVDLSERETPLQNAIAFSGQVETDPDAKVKYTSSGFQYYDTLPLGSVRCLQVTQFYRLKQNARTWKKDNIELKVGMYFLIYSPTSQKYYLRQVHEDFDPESYKQYIRDKNLYLIKQ